MLTGPNADPAPRTPTALLGAGASPSCRAVPAGVSDASATPAEKSTRRPAARDVIAASGVTLSSALPAPAHTPSC